MNDRKYNVITCLLAILVSPILVSIGFILFSMMDVSVWIASNLLVVLFWFLYGLRLKQDKSIFKIILPLFWGFCYYMILWIIIFALAKYRFDSPYFAAYFYLSLPYIVINFYVAMMNEYVMLPQIFTFMFLSELISVLIGYKIGKKKVYLDKKPIRMALIVISICGLSTYQFYDRGNRFLPSDTQIDKISDEVNLNDYQPFSKNNLLQRLDEPPTIMIGNNYPRLDGATAAYPVYGAITQEIYKGLNESTVNNYVQCTKTNVAYERLINGEIDIFFGAQPSAEQIAQAKEKGIEFFLTPIAKEAFVFFVNVENTVESLTLNEIQDIYQKKITNWKQLGGDNETILPFQRPVNSGSQTIMLSKVMKDKPLPQPLFEEFAEGMGGIISEVASYRNYSSSIGYSFRYYATGMKPNKNIKLLAINGIKPTVENIQSGSYPFTVDVYAVTAGSTNSNTQILIDWILTEQGQSFIEKSGYVKARSN